jgi:hypothetical protein
MFVDGEHLPRLHLAHEGRADDVQRGGFARHDPAPLEPAQHQWPHAVLVAGGVKGVLVHEDEAEGALDRGQHLKRGRLYRQVGLGRQQHRDQRRVACRTARVEAQLAHAAGEVGGVDEISVVRQRDRGTRRGCLDGGLSVLPRRAAGGGIARMPDREIAAQAGQGGFVEDLRHQAEILVDDDAGAVADGHAGRLLAPMLQRIEPVVGELGHIFARGPDTEDTTCVSRAWPVGVELLAQPAVASGHCCSLR